MRTLALNSNLPNFKALHIPRDRYFSPAQTNILNDIEKKVSQAPLNTIDFYAEPRKKDSLELFIYDKEADKKDSIGLFNEDYPFDTDETGHSIRKAQLWNNKAGSRLSLALFSGVIALLLGLAMNTKSKPIENQNMKQCMIFFK